MASGWTSSWRGAPALACRASDWATGMRVSPAPWMTRVGAAAAAAAPVVEDQGVPAVLAQIQADVQVQLEARHAMQQQHGGLGGIPPGQEQGAQQAVSAAGDQDSALAVMSHASL